MNAAATKLAASPSRPRARDRVRASLATFGAAVLGAAPHVLHHVGPLAGAALLAGATGKLLFGALGLLLAIPLLRRLRRRHDSWAVPGAVLALMAVVFAFSTFVIGPALTGANDEPAPTSSPSAPAPGQSQPDDPGRPTPDEHESHH
jgi:hypothetical protein